MPNIPYAIASAGASALRLLSSISPTLGGKVAKGVDIIGRALGNPLPETGATEAAESKGGVTLFEKNPELAMQKEQSRSQQLGIAPSARTQNITITKDLIQSGINNPNLTPMGQSPLKHERAMGANVGDIRDFGGALWRWNGEVWEPVGGGGGGGDNKGAPLGEQGVREIAARIPGLTEEDFSKLDISRWAQETQGRADEIARQIEEAAIANAEREYNTIKEALAAQRGEIQTLSAQQREQLGKQKQFTEEGLIEKETTETEKIKKQEEAFRQETEQQKEALATNWRDLSLETQRVMRARGISDSAFAASQDAKLMLDFNKGLRQIAVKSEAAYKDFADAVIETNKFYTRERQKLQMDYDKALTDIDNWVRQNIQQIQAQENMALNRKLAEIKNAILQANQLRAQTAQKIADQQLALATWMAQFQAQLKVAVATAAQGKVADAWKNIAAVRQNTNIIKTVLENGGEFVRKLGEDGLSHWYVHGPVIRPDGTFDFVDLPVTEGFVETSILKQASSLSGQDVLGLSNKPTFEQVYGALTTPGIQVIGGNPLNQTPRNTEETPSEETELSPGEIFKRFLRT